MFSEIIRLKFKEKKEMVIIDAPLLYETKFLEFVCYPILVPYCDEQAQMERLMKRNGMSESDARSRLDA